MNNNDVVEAKRIILNQINKLNGEDGTVGDFTLENEPSLSHVQNKLALFNQAFSELVNDGLVEYSTFNKKMGVIRPTLTKAGRLAI